MALHAPGFRIPLAGDGGTVTVSTPLLNLTQAWSGTATFTLDFANVTADPGPSNVASLLIDRQYLGASKFKVQRDGSVTAANNVAAGGSVTASGSVGAGSYVFTGLFTVAGLVAASAGVKGYRATVTDGSVTASGNFGAIVAGSGSNIVPVYCDGTNWRIG